MVNKRTKPQTPKTLIRENGNWVYELPTDATCYKLVTGKSGTNELYQIQLK
ncbi:hypothetical protein DOT_1975 [Desulfosporosinus sp. OT]|nr:hypothetical protein DOT_1975 [Desulfosporosinus sp. OT]